MEGFAMKEIAVSPRTLTIYVGTQPELDYEHHE